MHAFIYYLFNRSINLRQTNRVLNLVTGSNSLVLEGKKFWRVNSNLIKKKMQKMCEQASYFYFRNPIPSSKEEVSATFCGKTGSEICQAKRNSSSLCFPSHFPQWLFGLQLLRAVTYNSASVWTVGTSLWLYISAEVWAVFQAHARHNPGRFDQRVSRPEMNVGDSN